MVIREEIKIEAPPGVVWSVFTCLEQWDRWNAVCRAAFLIDSFHDRVSGGPISEGDCISFAIRPMLFPVRITPRITRCVPEKEIVWEGSRFGIKARHSFTFTERDGSVVVTSSERFSGLGLLFGGLLLLPSRLHRLTRELLASLKKEAESRAPSGEERARKPTQ